MDINIPVRVVSLRLDTVSKTFDVDLEHAEGVGSHAAVFTGVEASTFVQPRMDMPHILRIRPGGGLDGAAVLSKEGYIGGVSRMGGFFRVDLYGEELLEGKLPLYVGPIFSIELPVADATGLVFGEKITVELIPT